MTESKLKEVTSCQIVLASPSLTIPDGTTSLAIKGKISFTLSAPLKLSQIVLKLHGYSQFDNSQKTAITRNVNVKDLVKQKLTVVNITKNYPAGETNLPFALIIKTPQNLPATVEGKHAQIRYVLTAELTKAGHPPGVYKTSKNVIIRKRILNADGLLDPNEKLVLEDEKENLLKYKVLISKYLIVSDTEGQDGDAAEPRGTIEVEASFESLAEKTGVKEVKVEAFEYEMYNFAKVAAAGSGSTPSKTTSKAPVKRTSAKIPAFSAISIQNPHHTNPLITPALTIPITTTDSASPVAKFEIPITTKMKPDSNASFLEVKHEIVLTIRFDKFMLMPLQLEVPVIVTTESATKSV
ncbi:6552_t:CDS:2 [Ambispora gerdemannii]|uniref:6552_t:CDS:1 n=1 Tax=Ambispora gerdemannii TaxID=144530 RepID=A0A9N8VIR8_9GLOM|nr:6552_t:CDS:2 [Ambispora gerdemannii]